MKTHFVRTSREGKTRCGRISGWHDVAWHWQHVTCKQCLKRRGETQ